MKSSSKTAVQIAEIGVDAGLCWIGDPCYILHANPLPRALGKDWEDFCDILRDGGRNPDYMQFDYDLGHTGLGVAVSTGYGDGTYPVYAEFTECGRVARVWVEFIGEDGETDGDARGNP